MYASAMNSKWTICISAATLILLFLQSAATAVDGTWENPANGDYNTADNWIGNAIASGVGATADFNSVNLVGDVSVTLNADVTLGHMIIGDTVLGVGSEGTWEFRTDNTPVPTITLDAGGGTPSITVNELTPTGFDDAFIAHRLNGTAGLSKNGVGILSLSGAAGTLAGPINVNAGTLRLVAPYTNTGTTAYNLANGTTLETAVGIPAAAIAAGGSATINATANLFGFNVTAPVATPGNPEVEALTVNVGTETTSQTFDLYGAWTGFGAVTFNGTNPGGMSFLRIVPSLPNTPPAGVNAGFNAASLATAAVTLNNAQTRVRTNSFGNTIVFGSLSGTGELAGGNGGPSPPGGSAARYEVGGLNTSTTFSGTINGEGGVSLNKVGTGTLTLAGTFVVPVATNSLAVNNTLARQGGVIRVTGGTLKMTGADAVPGGFGAILTTIDVLAGATFDVTATPGTFSTSSLQKLQGSGTILGTYNHDEGFVRPADVGAATNANEGNLSSGVVPTAGTINFNGALQLNGGTIIYDMAPTPGAGNDLVNVTGTVALNSGTISPNFLSGIPTSGTYTVITASGGFSGLASNIAVDFPGRGADPEPTISGNSLVFTPSSVGAAADVVWRGNHGTNPTFWDIETTQNWVNGASPDVFFNLDSVTFDDTAVGTAVDVRTIVQPNSTPMKPVAINISGTKDFSFTGAGSITGPGGLTKTGTGTLMMQVANTFTGPASIQGTVDIGGVSGLGTGQLTLNNATVLSTASLANSEVVVPAGTTSEIRATGGGVGLGGALNISTLSGDGTLTLSATVDDKAFGLGVTDEFTGTLNIEPAAPATFLNAVRARGGQTTFPNAVVNITGARISNQQGGAIGSTVNFEFGELHGDATTQLNAFEGGSADKPNANWQIGALNTDSDLAGTIVDGATPSISLVTKVGTGTLTLSGANTYSGATTVNGGTLLINGTHQRNETTMLAVSDYTVNTGGTLGGTGAIGNSLDPVDVILAGGAINPGASVGTLTVNGNVSFGDNGIFDIEIDANAGTSDTLVVNGNLDLSGLNDRLRLSLAAGSLPEAGPLTIATYTGSLAGTFNLDNADFTINYGDGSNDAITISNITSIQVGLPGDYNNDGRVDAGDYVRWRNNLGDPTEADINNNGDGGGVTITDYTHWKNNYGNPGAGGGGLTNAAVPEPASILLVLFALVAGSCIRRR